MIDKDLHRQYNSRKLPNMGGVRVDSPEKTCFELQIAGISIRICAPFDMAIPWDLQPFVSPCADPAVCYEIQLIHKPLTPESTPLTELPQLRVYRQSDGWLRIYPHLSRTGDCCAALLLRNSGNHTLYLPADDLDRYRVKGVLSPILGLEHILMMESGFILHSSVVIHQGKAILFCGASGTGKSTQADLWHTHLGAKIVNGDRCAVMCREDAIYGCGSPFSGSSEIYTADEAPVAAIIFVEKGSQNRLSPTPATQAFTTLYAQSAANTWNADYTRRLCDLLERVLQDIPLYTLTCLPDTGAVELTKNTIFPNG